MKAPPRFLLVIEPEDADGKVVERIMRLHCGSCTRIEKETAGHLEWKTWVFRLEYVGRGS
jgi:hypothetical protein